MRCIPRQSQTGFTLVEISIVMIIIGLLIGGTFGGMKLIENMRVNRTVQDLKSIESAALTFKDTYGRLPGDLVNPAARLPNCTVAPCATAGNGNRIIGPANHHGTTITNSDENYTFWHHMQAADLLSLGISNTLDMTYGVGTPSAGADYGIRVGDVNATAATACVSWNRTVAYLTNSAADVQSDVDCAFIRQIDGKVDDGMPNTGKLHGAAFYHCVVGASVACDAQYVGTGTGLIMFDLKGF